MVKILASSVAALITIIAGYLLFQKSPSGKNHLRVYSYSSFSQPWSAGPVIAELFEREFKCSVEVIDAGDSALLIQKLKIDPRPVDLVVGLDQDSFSGDTLSVGWKKISAPNVKRWARPDFIPFDWSPLTFVVRKSSVPAPESWEQLLKPTYKKTITLPDPRTSNLGWQFIKWILSDKGEEGALRYLKDFRGQIFSAPASWSSSYGLFQSGQGNVALSYLTSILYHRWEEKNVDDYTVANFASGHPVQVEYVGIPQKCESCGLAQEFINFLLRHEIQEILLKKNYMLPIAEADAMESSSLNLPKLRIKENISQVPEGTKKKMLNYWVDLWK